MKASMKVAKTSVTFIESVRHSRKRKGRCLRGMEGVPIELLNVESKREPFAPFKTHSTLAGGIAVAFNSTCVKCGKSSFEVVVDEPSGSQYKLVYVQCSFCGGVAGVLPYIHTNGLLEKQGKWLKQIGEKLGLYFRD
jgi:hypothetical protein